MKKKDLFSSAILLLTFLIPVARADNLTQFIVEKKLDVDRKTGFILSSELKALHAVQPRRATVIASRAKAVPATSLSSGDRTYSLVNEPDTFNSVVSVKDFTGAEIKRISVGRKATKIITAAGSRHLYVLCGGYFGSVWEIDPEKNQVVRKFSTSWNPTDLALDPSEKFLYVTSGKLQKFSLDSDVVLEIDLPADIRYLNSVSQINSTLVFGGINKDALQASYKLDSSINKLVASDTDAVYVSSRDARVNVQRVSPGDSADVAIIYSKNNDFLYLLSMSRGEISGLIPLDARADEVLIAPSVNRAFVLHRLIGQISIIDLKPETNTQFSVTARILDDRLKDPSNTMVLEGNKVFIKSDAAQEGYIDTDNILRYTYPVVEIPLIRERDIVAVSKLANKRFYLKNKQLFVENLTDNSVNYNRKTRLNDFGDNIGGIAMGPAGKVFYISNPSQNNVLAVDTFTNKVLTKYTVGAEPAELAVKNNFLFVLNHGDQTLGTIDLKTGRRLKVSRLKVENNNLNLIKLYDKDFDQIIRVTLAQDVNKELAMVKAEN